MTRYVLAASGLTAILTGALGVWVNDPVSAGLFIGVPALMIAVFLDEDNDAT